MKGEREKRGMPVTGLTERAGLYEGKGGGICPVTWLHLARRNVTRRICWGEKSRLTRPPRGPELGQFRAGCRSN